MLPFVAVALYSIRYNEFREKLDICIDDKISQERMQHNHLFSSQPQSTSFWFETFLCSKRNGEIKKSEINKIILFKSLFSMLFFVVFFFFSHTVLTPVV